MTHQFYRVRSGTPGALILMAAPHRASLAARVGICRSLDVARIVSLLATDEARRLGLADEAAVCHDHGLAFEHFPIEDFGVPDMAAFASFINGIADDLARGNGIAIHCRAGIGRTGTAASCVLQILGHSPDDAMALVGAARRTNVPETAGQADFIRGFTAAAGL